MNPGTPVRWPAERIEAAIAILRRHSSMPEALEEMSRAFGFGVTFPAIDGVLRKLQLGKAHAYLGKDAGGVTREPIPPVDQRDTERMRVAPAIELPDDSHTTPPEPEPDPVRVREAHEETARFKRQIQGLVDELRNARARQAFLDIAAELRAPPRIMSRESDSGPREMTAIVLASDWHVEEPVDPVSVAYRNEYNLEIADQRVRRFFNAIIWHIEHQRASGRIALRDLVLWLGGDFITGFIHPELVESNLLSPTETIRWLLPRLRDGIWSVLSALDLEHIEIPCSFGNHGRTTDKPRISTGYANSYEWLMYHSLSDEFRGENRIHFEITNSPHQYVQVYDWMLHFHHGDDVKYQGGVGGLGIPLLKAVPMWDLVRYADIHNIGHHHSLRDYGRAVVNGSLIGYGPYSQRIRAQFEPPQQALYYVDKKRGKCMLTQLWVDEDSSHARQQPAA